jgi:Bacteriophage baseplate protein W
MTPLNRQDYAVPFQIDPGLHQVSRTDYPHHVDQMILQVLLTAPGERADLPQFGCGLRQLVFAPLSSALAASTELLVRQALGRWLAGVIDVADVTVASDDAGSLQVTISYTMIDTLSAQQTTVTVS